MRIILCSKHWKLIKARFCNCIIVKELIGLQSKRKASPYISCLKADNVYVYKPLCNKVYCFRSHGRSSLVVWLIIDSPFQRRKVQIESPETLKGGNFKYGNIIGNIVH